MNFESALRGAVFRAAICETCGGVCAVAIDERESMDRVNIRHASGFSGGLDPHEVWLGDQRLMHWYPARDGSLKSCGMQKDMIVRVGKGRPLEDGA